ncbi:MAG: hypothetical protein EBZ45_07095, partial [Actinobacteria bacterium]|nr:hypothetical protein [Actinomycetota bacterium]
EGQKMSKSKGNVIDPLDIVDGIALESLVSKRTTGLMQPRLAPAIEKATRKAFPQGIEAHGTDALRLTFASLATQSADLRFDLARVGGYRNFCNKLWNAARYVLMTVETDTTGALEPGIADRWIRSRLDATLVDVERAFAEYRFDFAATALGESTNTALFVGAALTATSIGITARVFGDLRALSTPEARTVLGAAVADDVLGLIILTVVTRIVQQGSVDIATVSSTIGLAVGFLVVSGFIGLAVFPGFLRRIGSASRSSSTIPVVAIALVLAFAVLADLANLAPIIGAFVAGLGLRKVAVHERIERDLSSLGQIFVPVFFLYIGISTDVSSMLDGRVLLVALLLSAIAIVGKLLSAFGALGTTSDKLVIGFGMLPRGEVGLIFATIGLSVGALNDELYGSILVVVLLTTLIAPPLLRWRI